jgi:transcriptional regulator NrdR family protein
VIRTDGNRRRRECLTCRHRWNTFELVEEELMRLKRVSEIAADLSQALQANHLHESTR